MKKNNTTADEWFKLGDSDFRFAKTGFEANDFFHIICFQCQQAVEKYLKGYLTYHGQRFPKIHHLPRLVRLCWKIDPSFNALIDRAKLLDAFYIETRYSGAAFETFTKKEAEEALKTADEIIRVIQTKLT